MSADSRDESIIPPEGCGVETSAEPGGTPTPTPTATPIACPAGQQLQALGGEVTSQQADECVPNTLAAAYFNGFEVLDTPILRNDAEINFGQAATDWNYDNALDALDDRRKFSVRWTGLLEVPNQTISNVVFRVSDSGIADGARLWLYPYEEIPQTELEPIIDTWLHQQDIVVTSQPQTLDRKFVLWLEYYHYDLTGATNPTFKLEYSTNGTSWEIVPGDWLTGKTMASLISEGVQVPPQSLGQAASCSVDQIALVPVFPRRSNEAYDMYAVAQDTDIPDEILTNLDEQNNPIIDPPHIWTTLPAQSGLILHDGPTINARRIAVIPWGSTITVDAFITFPQTNLNEQLWYRVVEFTDKEGNQYQILEENSEKNWTVVAPDPDTPEAVAMRNAMASVLQFKIGEDEDGNPIHTLNDFWINVRYPDIVGQSNQPQYFNYIVGADKERHPCTDISDITNSSTETITFTYDRENATDYGIAQGIQNSQFAVVQPTSFSQIAYRTSSISPFANFAYAITFGATQRTASAVFISEVLWMGGLPFTENFPDECVAQEGQPTPVTNTGWRYCAGNISTSWRIHEGVAEYYTSGYVPSQIPQVGGGGATVDGNTLLDSMGSSVGQMIIPQNNNGIPFIQAVDIQTNADGSGFINLGSGATAGTPKFGELSLWLTQKINTTELTIQSGDYIWIKPGSGDDHGFIIVGWQEAVNCREALDNGFSNYYTTSTDALNAGVSAPIPYVVDFTRLQRVQPRPFFCTRFSDPESNYDNPATVGVDDDNRFTEHDWYFYTMPDVVTVEASKLYVSPDWSWQSSNGNFPYSQ